MFWREQEQLALSRFMAEAEGEDANPYLKEAAAAKFGDHWDYVRRDLLEGWKELPCRHTLVDRYSWSIPSMEAVELVASFGKVMDPLAGTGYWMGLVEAAGATIRANDLNPMFGNHWHRPGHRFVPIACGPGERFVQQYPDYALFLSWPPYEGTCDEEESPRGVGYRVLKAYTEAGGQDFIFVGEGGWGCTGCSDMFKYIDRNWTEVSSTRIPQWSGMNDWLTIFTRKVR